MDEEVFAGLVLEDYDGYGGWDGRMGLWFGGEVGVLSGLDGCLEGLGILVAD